MFGCRILRGDLSTFIYRNFFTVMTFLTFNISEKSTNRAPAEKSIKNKHKQKMGKQLGAICYSLNIFSAPGNIFF